MTSPADDLERQLVHDLDRMAERLVDDKQARELYGALTNHTLVKDGEPGHLSVSWTRAEEIVNGIRARNGQEALAGLAQSGREGETAPGSREALQSVGWTIRELDTSRHDEAHATDPPNEPPQGGETPEWERQAHADADAVQRERRLP